ncbi:MAG: hypothetical protein Q8L85_07930 [Alphaproteobacteria bacterium]|nr:hypothetical protein [Alphaproteobacteria bacterium]
MKKYFKLIPKAFFLTSILYTSQALSNPAPSTDATSQAAVSPKAKLFESAKNACENDYRDILGFEVKKRHALGSDHNAVYDQFKKESQDLAAKKNKTQKIAESSAKTNAASFDSDLNNYRATCSDISLLKKRIVEAGLRLK